MSIEIHAFLGNDLLDLEARLVRRFSEAGFRIELHPDSSLLEKNASATLYVAILEAPSFLKRIVPGQALLAGFGYVPVAADPRANPDRARPPAKAGAYTWELQTRSASGRSQAAYFMQALTAAILASETQGRFFVAGDTAATTGKAGLARILRELHGLEETNEQMRKIAQNAKAGNTQEDALFAARLERGLSTAFDEGAFPFTAWPPLDASASYRWPAPIVSPAQAGRALPLWRKKQKMTIGQVLYWTLGWGLVAAFTLITLIYA
jgi:hypothetical protein